MSASTDSLGDDAFRVLAEPTRRRILDLLAEHGTLSVTDLAAHFPDLVASGISKHLMALRAAGLVTATKQGRHQLYAVDHDALGRALEPWLSRHGPRFDAALGRLRARAESATELATEPASLAETPAPPYTAVIFTSLRTAGDGGYAATAARMVELAAAQPGFLGIESARDGLGITVSYWAAEADAAAWKQIAEHLVTQRRGQQEWYADYRVRIATVTREYGQLSERAE